MISSSSRNAIGLHGLSTVSLSIPPNIVDDISQFILTSTYYSKVKQLKCKKRMFADFLAADPEVPGSIPGANIFS
jgi:hypothetical protein